MLLQVSSKTTTPTLIIKQIYNIQSQPSAKKSVTHDEQSSIQTKVIIDDSPLFAYELCSLCHPETDHKIIARSGKDGLKIHSLSCKALSSISLHKLIKARRSDQEE
jgi:hypothetical protein